VVRHQTPVPAQKRGRPDEKRRPAASRQHPARCCQEQSVGWSKRRPRNLPAKDREFVTQDDDLKVFERSRPESQTDQVQNALKRDVANGRHGTSSKFREKAAILREPD
jgi:hypothetical protein